MVSIIIVNFNGVSDTINCINSILKSDNSEYIIVLVDNASLDNSILLLSNTYHLNNVNQSIKDIGISDVYVDNEKRIFLLSSQKNGGFAAANNQGIKFVERLYPDIEYYWLLNNDTKIENNTINKLLNSDYINNEKIGIIGTKLLFLDNPNKIQALGGKYNPFRACCSHIGAYKNDSEINLLKKTIKVDYVVGASMLVKKNFVRTVGYMEESYFLYFEELDWILRGYKYGYIFKIDYNVRVLHKEGGSTKNTIKMISEVADICQLRNRIVFTRKYYPKYLISVLFFTLITIIKRFKDGYKDRAISLFIVYIKQLQIICKIH